MALQSFAVREYPELVITRPGLLTTGASPPYFRRPNGGTVTEFFAALGTAGTGTTTVVLRRAGVDVATLDLTSGETTKSSGDLDLDYTDTQLLTVAVTAAGTAAADLTAIVRWADE